MSPYVYVLNYIHYTKQILKQAAFMSLALLKQEILIEINDYKNGTTDYELEYVDLYIQFYEKIKDLNDIDITTTMQVIIDNNILGIIKLRIYT